MVRSHLRAEEAITPQLGLPEVLFIYDLPMIYERQAKIREMAFRQSKRLVLDFLGTLPWSEFSPLISSNNSDGVTPNALAVSHSVVKVTFC